MSPAKIFNHKEHKEMKGGWRAEVRKPRKIREALDKATLLGSALPEMSNIRLLYGLVIGFEKRTPKPVSLKSGSKPIRDADRQAPP